MPHKITPNQLKRNFESENEREDQGQLNKAKMEANDKTGAIRDAEWSRSGVMKISEPRSMEIGRLWGMWIEGWNKTKVNKVQLLWVICWKQAISKTSRSCRAARNLLLEKNQKFWKIKFAMRIAQGWNKYVAFIMYQWKVLEKGYHVVFYSSGKV